MIFCRFYVAETGIKINIHNRVQITQDIHLFLCKRTGRSISIAQEEATYMTMYGTLIYAAESGSNEKKEKTCYFALTKSHNLSR